MAALPPRRQEEIRRFAYAVGCVLIGFMIVASLFHSFRPEGFRFMLRRAWVGGLGLVMIFTGFAAPAALDWPEKQWMRLAHFLGYWNTRILLTVIFYLGVVPMGLVARAFGWDELKMRRPAGDSFYEPAAEHLADPKHFEHPF